MATADLDYIRALLVAQTAEPEPQAKGLLARLFAARSVRAAPPLNLTPAPEPPWRRLPPLTPEGGSDPDQALLLEHICRPPAVDESLSPLPPPTPRGAFGRRQEGEREAELMLDRPAAELRRLRVLDPTGAAIGEMILRAAAPTVVLSDEDLHAVPYFPEDLMDGGEAPTIPPLPESVAGPRPMRPWIKALRSPSIPTGGDRPARSTDPAASRAKGARRRKADSPAPSGPPRPKSLGQDILEALALTLEREHATLTDRMLFA
jgi:hypothetical protein